jgi:hypothetical protein
MSVPTVRGDVLPDVGGDVGEAVRADTLPIAT